MEPITWITVASLLIKYGPEVADFIVKKIHAGDVVTEAEWAEFMLFANKTAASQLNEAFLRADVVTDPNLVAMLPKKG